MPIVVGFGAVMSFMNNGFRIYPEVLLEPLNIGLFVALVTIIGIRFKLDEWLDNEREYKAWKLYKSKGNILNVN